jgi:hypothetical protein
VLAICLVKLFYQGLTTERDLLYLFVIVYVGAVTFYSERVSTIKEVFPNIWHKTGIVISLFMLISILMYIEKSYSITFLIKSQITYSTLLFSIIFLPVAMIVRRVKR